MSPYPSNWSLLVKIIKDWKPTQLRFIETPDGLACETGSIVGLDMHNVVLSRPNVSISELRDEVVRLLDKHGYWVAHNEGNGLTVRREVTTVSARPITPIEIVQYLLRQHQPQKLYLSWNSTGGSLEFVSTHRTPLYRHTLATRDAVTLVDTYLRERGWRVVGETASPRTVTVGDRQYER